MYKIKVNNTFNFDLADTDLDQLNAVETTKDHFHILNENASVQAAVLDYDFNKKQYRIKVNSNTYDVAISDALDQQIEALGFELGNAKQVNNIKAPMPGLILEINVDKGQEVKEDDTLLILEAMKMENVITSPREGVIKSVQVSQGEAVDKNTLLIEFE